MHAAPIKLPPLPGSSGTQRGAVGAD
jgi:hypothetical protein